MKEQVVLVNEFDEEIGTEDKMLAHENGSLHRAFSVILYNSHGDMLIQKRAESKYHSPGLWSNACCSHPRPDETMNLAVKRRLKEEIGLECNVQFEYKFVYKVELENGLVEHEVDHVFIGQTNETPILNTSEAKEWKYLSPKELKDSISNSPHEYTYWFKLIVARLLFQSSSIL